MAAAGRAAHKAVRENILAKIQSVVTGFYRVPLPEILTDSTHGIMRDFELVTAQVHDADGAEGVGYTFTVGRNGGAIANIIEREMAAIIHGRDASLIEALWHTLWWDMHYGGRGGPTVLALSANDMALWDTRQGNCPSPCGNCWADFPTGCRAMPEASTWNYRCPSSSPRPTATRPAASAP